MNIMDEKDDVMRIGQAWANRWMEAIYKALPQFDAEINENTVGQILYRSGRSFTFTDKEMYMKAVKEEMDDIHVTGVKYKTFTSDPEVHYQIDTFLYDKYGEENPYTLEDYIPKEGQEGMSLKERLQAAKIEAERRNNERNTTSVRETRGKDERL